MPTKRIKPQEVRKGMLIYGTIDTPGEGPYLWSDSRPKERIGWTAEEDWSGNVRLKVSKPNVGRSTGYLDVHEVVIEDPGPMYIEDHPEWGEVAL